MAQGFDTLGFNVLREVNGMRVKLNRDLIPAQSLSGGGGERYTFVDSGPPGPGRTYWIENVLFSLDSRWYGPVAPVSVPDCTSVAVAAVPGAAVPTAIPSAGGPSAPAEQPGDQMGGCAVGAGRGTTVLPLALAALGLALLRRRRSR
jgi:MYXO-CTERM domain-containing protein